MTASIIIVVPVAVVFSNNTNPSEGKYLNIIPRTDIKSLDFNLDLFKEKQRIDTVMNGDDNQTKLVEMQKYFTGEDLSIENVNNGKLTVETYFDKSLILTLKSTNEFLFGDKDNKFSEYKVFLPLTGAIIDLTVAPNTTVPGIQVKTETITIEDTELISEKYRIDSIMGSLINMKKMIELQKYFIGDYLSLGTVNNLDLLTEIIPETPVDPTELHLTLKGKVGFNFIIKPNNEGIQKKIFWKTIRQK